MCKRMKKIKTEVKDEIDLTSTTIVTKDPYTYVETRAGIDGHTYIGAGFSKRNPIDDPDTNLGVKIALGRAIHGIALQVYETRFGKPEDMDYTSSPRRSKPALQLSIGRIRL